MKRKERGRNQEQKISPFFDRNFFTAILLRLCLRMSLVRETNRAYSKARDTHSRNFCCWKTKSVNITGELDEEEGYSHSLIRQDEQWINHAEPAKWESERED